MSGCHNKRKSFNHDQFTDKVRKIDLPSQNYISCLPTELFTSLFLYFSSDELHHTLSQVEQLSEFRRLFTLRVFWKELWSRDISSVVPVPNDSYTKYIEILEYMNESQLNISRISKLAEHGYDKLFYPLITNFYEHELALQSVAKGGHIELVEKLLKGMSKRDIENSSVLSFAAENGNMILINRLLELIDSQIEYKCALAMGARHGHMQVVNKMLELGVTNYNWGLIYAAEGGHIDIVQKMLDLGATNYNRAMQFAANKGHIKIVKIMLEKGATNFNSVISTIVNKDIIKLLLDYGADDYIKLRNGKKYNNRL